MEGEGVAAGPRQGAAAGEDGGDQPEAVEAVEAGDATSASDDACTNSADQREHGDGASLLHEGGRAALDGEVIPPAPAGLFDEVIAFNDELAAGLRSTVETAVRLGQALIRAKERCPHGTWLPTLERCTRIKARSASSYMKLAKAWSMWSAKHRQQIADLGLVAALADLSRRERDAREAGRHHRRLAHAKERDPDPAVEPATTPAMTEEQATSEPERQQELVPAPAVKPAVAASTVTRTKMAKTQEPAVAPSPSSEIPIALSTNQPPSGAAPPRMSGADLWQAIVSLRRGSEKGDPIARLNELKSLDRHSARRLELLDAHIGAQARFLAGLRSLREQLGREAATGEAGA